MTVPVLRRRSRATRWPRRSAGAVAAAVAATFAVVVLARALPGPAVVEAVTVRNPTAYDIRVEVTDGDRDGWTVIGTAARDGDTLIDDVLDRGDRWVVRFFAQGAVAGDVTLTRAQLVDDGWRIAVPDGMADRLAGAGVTPQP